MLKNIFIPLLAIPLFAGCASMTQLDQSAAAPSDDESVLIIGIKSPDYYVVMFPGSVENGTFVKSSLYPAAIGGYPKEGYIARRVRSGITIAITSVSHGNPDSHFGIDTTFVPCRRVKTMVFKVPAGKIAYLGSVDYRFAGKRLHVQYANEFYLAQQYTDSHFPALKGKLEYIAPDFMGTTEPCQTVSYIPIYI